MKIHKPLLWLILLAATVTVLAAEPASAPASAAQAAEIAVLKAQLDVMRQMQDSFLSMAQWALGTAVAVGLALAAFGWHTNKTNYERDREALQSEAKALRDSLAATLKEGLREAQSAVDQSLAARQTAIQAAVEKANQAKLDAQAAKLNGVRDDVYQIQAESMEKEADESVTKAMYGWAVYKYGQVLDLYVTRHTDEYEAADILDKLLKIVRTQGVSLDADTVNTAVETLQRLPKRHHAACEPLISGLKRCLR